MVGHNEKKKPMYECRVCKEGSYVPVFVGSLKSVYRHNIRDHGLMVRSRGELAEMKKKKKKREENAAKIKRRSGQEKAVLEKKSVSELGAEMFADIGIPVLEVYEGCLAERGELMTEYLSDLIDVWKEWGSVVTRLVVEFAVRRAARCRSSRGQNRDEED